MWESIKGTFSKYFRFGGIAGRREFWIWTFMVLAVSVVLLGLLWGLMFILHVNCTIVPLFIFWLVAFFPSMTVAVRRLRDAGICPWTLLIPAALCIVTFFVLADIGLSNMDGSTARYSDAFAIILSAVTAMTWFVFLILFCLPSKK
ncbi:MAG: DUF805 domain-containing protein [Bacteroidaceae bacterium]|nr:DUF805 domain-containing protein [Bacteroidaceae bacterium]